jgi:hypothetical protein
MTVTRANFDPRLEEFLAELTAAAYRVSLRYGVKGSSIDLELDLWRELRAVLRQQRLAVDSPPSAGERGEARSRPGRTVQPEPLDLMEVVV